MSGSSLFRKLRESPEFKGILEALEEKNRVTVSGLAGTSKALVAAALYKVLGKPMVVIIPEDSQSETVSSDLKFFYEFFNGNDNPEEGADSYSGDGEFLHFPGTRCEPFELLSPHIDIRTQRIRTLNRVLNGDRFCLAVSGVALSRPLLPRQIFSNSVMKLSKGSTLSIELFSVNLVRQGYKRVDTVTNVGEFCVRGGIIDVFSPGSSGCIIFRYSIADASLIYS